MIALRQNLYTTPVKFFGGLCLTAEDPNVVVNMTKNRASTVVSLEYSRDGVDWHPFDCDAGSTPVTLAMPGALVYFRAGAGGNTAFASFESGYRCFTITGGRCAASGDLTSLISRDFPVLELEGDYALYRLFGSCSNLTSAPSLPSITLSGACYGALFYGCTALKVAPRLPAATSGPWSYMRMFWGCSSLQTIEVGFTSFGAGVTDATYQWVRNVNASGTFRCPTALGTNATIARGESACPSGWTVENTD